MSMMDAEGMKLLLQQGAKAPEILPVPEGGERVVVIPTGMTVQSLKQFLPPQRIEQRVTLREAESFIAYVNRFKSDDTMIFTEVADDEVQFMAIMDYHHAKDRSPDYCRHMAFFQPLVTPEWQTWSEHDEKAMTQVQFATFLENQQHVFVNPTGAELLELVKSLHGHRNARFNTSLRLDNGAFSVAFEEDIVVRGSNGTKQGEMVLPPEIMAGFSVFLGAAPYKVRARLKSRISDRQLVLFYETIQRDAIVRESILLLVEQVAKATGIVPLLGRA